jgi:hypothetical protein
MEYEESLRLLSRDRRSMGRELQRIQGLTVFPSQGNFFLVKLPNEWSGVALRDYLVANHGIMTRECGNKLGMTSQFMRLVVRPGSDVDRLVDGMLDYAQRFHSRSVYDSDPLENVRMETSRRWADTGAYDDQPDSPLQYPNHRAGGEYTARRAAVG